MSPEGLQDVAAILSSRVLSQFISLEETATFEAKGEPYDLHSAPGRYEFAKDIVAMANAEGGYLIIGLETERSPDRDADIVTGLKLLPEADISAGQYAGVLKDYVYPRLNDLDVTFVEDVEAELGVAAIYLPPQRPDSGPYLVLKVVEDSAELKQLFVGYVQRQGGHNVPISAQSLHQHFKKGSDSIAVRLGRIEEKLDAVLDRRPAPAAKAKPDTERRDRRIKNILEGDE